MPLRRVSLSKRRSTGIISDLSLMLYLSYAPKDKKTRMELSPPYGINHSYSHRPHDRRSSIEDKWAALMQPTVDTGCRTNLYEIVLIKLSC